MTVLLAVDVGNTNTVLGVFRDDELAAHWRIQTVAARTSDEYAVLLKTLLDMEGFPWKLDRRRDHLVGRAAGGVRAPAVLQARTAAAPRSLVGPGIKTGMPILYENPREVGADRIVNAVAAYEELQGRAASSSTSAPRRRGTWSPRRASTSAA